MNLLTTRWIAATRGDGTPGMLSPAEIGAADWREVCAPRPDFRNALYQLLIGLLQTAYAPADEDQWRERWDDPPDAATLAAALAPWQQAFELCAEGPAFMQDLTLADGELKSIAGLLIDAPGDNTVSKNLDHFVKRDMVQATCPSCTALALLTLQINAPSGGQGHRVSLRGGGPLTTLLLPQSPAHRADPPVTLWQVLWLNVLPAGHLALQPAPTWDGGAAAILPWLAPTRLSDPKGVETRPEDCHPLQAYWSMPRRIRLEATHTRAGHCDLCGADHPQLFTHYRTRNYGINYVGNWRHPLTPYNLDPKKPPLSLKGQQGGIGYRHWPALTIGRGEDGAVQQAAAYVVSWGLAQRQDLLGRLHRVWVAGYDMDNMKARCWYDATVPVYAVTRAQIPQLRNAVEALLDAANEVAKQVRVAIRQALQTTDPDPAWTQSYWQHSEPAFYQALAALVALPVSDEPALGEVYRPWLVANRTLALALFDQLALSSEIETCSNQKAMERTLLARHELLKWLNAAKPLQRLWKQVAPAATSPAKAGRRKAATS